MRALVDHANLKFDYWKKLARQRPVPVVKYDDVLDTFYFYIDRQQKEPVITHYVDEDVALLYRHSDKEIVGVKVEFLKTNFVPKYGNRNWSLSRTGIRIPGVKELVVKIDLSETTPFSRIATSQRIETRVHPEPIFA